MSVVYAEPAFILSCVYLEPVEGPKGRRVEAKGIIHYS